MHLLEYECGRHSNAWRPMRQLQSTQQSDVNVISMCAAYLCVNRKVYKRQNDDIVIKNPRQKEPQTKRKFYSIKLTRKLHKVWISVCFFFCFSFLFTRNSFRKQKMAYQTFLAEYMQIPIVTRIYTTACVITTIAVVSFVFDQIGSSVLAEFFSCQCKKKTLCLLNLVNSKLTVLQLLLQFFRIISNFKDHVSSTVYSLHNVINMFSFWS